MVLAEEAQPEAIIMTAASENPLVGATKDELVGCYIDEHESFLIENQDVVV